MHRAASWNPATSYDEQEYIDAVDASAVKPKVKRSIIATAKAADRTGVTTIDRAMIAAEVGYRDPDIIADHRHERSDTVP
ncbi:hypothetical protein LVY72_22690 [Arthrobacter sp. I2-34]|uniref:Uncharacterized protein n=1 Tax=Arthrobacter hankyongi TaxID=2904801 RepID=A0ABS9LDG4_9MICC|nr:hypothetical protein [Arthrobacter hankyongi]MCG2624701.1 hypothetical protein [Arthrobacter hankyongi]